MKNLLGHIDICGLPFEVYEATSEDAAYLEGKYGYCDNAGQKIYLEATQGPEAWRNTLIHEMCHGIIAHSGISAMIDMGGMEEAFIRVLVPHLLKGIDSCKTLRPGGNRKRAPGYVKVTPVRRKGRGAT
jgi:hypothetical protein